MKINVFDFFATFDDVFIAVTNITSNNYSDNDDGMADDNREDSEDIDDDYEDEGDADMTSQKGLGFSGGF